jgi:RNA polymerase sigma-70 factor (ECF subfamily)
MLPEAHGPSTAQPPEGAPATEIAWLGPYPDAALEGIPDAAPGPEARYELHESVQLAFVAAIQHLPPRQRAVLLLRDVLGFPVGETAGLLDASAASVNSALQRARATLARRFPDGQPSTQPVPDERQRALLDRYVQTWEGADFDAFVALLREDAVLSMPPWRQWYRGRGAIRAFLVWAWERVEHRPSRLVRIDANGQPAFAQYHGAADAPEWRAHSIWLPALRNDGIAALTGFIEPRLFAAFGLPAVLPTHAAADAAE